MDDGSVRTAAEPWLVSWMNVALASFFAFLSVQLSNSAFAKLQQYTTSVISSELLVVRSSPAILRMHQQHQQRHFHTSKLCWTPASMSMMAFLYIRHPTPMLPFSAFATQDSSYLYASPPVTTSWLVLSIPASPCTLSADNGWIISEDK